MTPTTLSYIQKVTLKKVAIHIEGNADNVTLHKGGDVKKVTLLKGVNAEGRDTE